MECKAHDRGGVRLIFTKINLGGVFEASLEMAIIWHNGMGLATLHTICYDITDKINLYEEVLGLI